VEYTGVRRKTVVSLFIIVAAIVAVAFFFNLLTGGKFLTGPNINAMCTSAVITSFFAWGYCFVFALGFMDLSIGAAGLLALYASGELGNLIGVPGVVIGGVLAGIILMTINFNIFAWTRIPSWIAGIGMCLLYEAIISWYAEYMQSQNMYVVLLKTEYRTLARFPYIYIVFAIGLAFAYLIYNRSTLGLNVRAIGSNPDVTKIMGVKIPNTVILTGVVCGILVGCAGFLRESHAGRMYPLTGLQSLSFIFQPLAAVLLAQVLEKWINIIVAVPLCALFVYICFNVLSSLGVPSGTFQEAVLGLCIVVFGVIAQRSTRGVVK